MSKKIEQLAFALLIGFIVLGIIGAVTWYAN